jgi:hypothetical protein
MDFWEESSDGEAEAGGCEIALYDSVYLFPRQANRITKSWEDRIMAADGGEKEERKTISGVA